MIYSFFFVCLFFVSLEVSFSSFGFRINAGSIESLRTCYLLLEIFEMDWHSVQFSHSVMFDSLRPHELQHARPPCPSPTPRVYSNSHPSGQWCHPAISSSVVPFSSSPQSLPASESFPMSQLLHEMAKVLEFQL